MEIYQGLMRKEPSTLNLKKGIYNYKYIKRGFEGTIYKYNHQFAIKKFYSHDETYLKRKYEKIEELMKIEDSSFCLPIGLVTYLGNIEGYYMHLVKEYKSKITKSDYYLRNASFNEVKKFIINGEDAIKRMHNRGIYIGDIKSNNIMVENGLPIFVDTDNYIVGDYSFDTIPYFLTMLNNKYNKSFSFRDIDIYFYTCFFLDSYFDNLLFGFILDDEIQNKVLDNLDIDKDIKEGIGIILSDADNKPYLGPIIEKIPDDSKKEYIKRKISDTIKR